MSSQQRHLHARGLSLVSFPSARHTIVEGLSGNRVVRLRHDPLRALLGGQGGTGMMWQLQYMFEAWRLLYNGRLVHCFEGDPL